MFCLQTSSPETGTKNGLDSRKPARASVPSWEAPLNTEDHGANRDHVFVNLSRLVQAPSRPSSSRNESSPDHTAYRLLGSARNLVRWIGCVKPARQENSVFVRCRPVEKNGHRPMPYTRFVNPARARSANRPKRCPGTAGEPYVRHTIGLRRHPSEAPRYGPHAQHMRQTHGGRK